MVKISVIMAVHNEEEFLADSINSILEQSFWDFEFVIIDDGSDDRTPELLKEYAKKDERIRVLRNREKMGLVFSLNRGMEVSRGEYIARMDGDDVSLRDRLKLQFEFMETHQDAGVLGTNVAYIDEKGNILKSKKDPFPLTPQLIKWHLFWRCPIYHPTVMIRKKVLIETGLYYREEYPHAEDYDLWTRLSKHTKIVSLPDVLLLYRIRPSSVSRKKRKVQLNSTLQIARREISSFLGRPVDERVLYPLVIKERNKDADPIQSEILLEEVLTKFLNYSLTPYEKEKIKQDVFLKILLLARIAKFQEEIFLLKKALKTYPRGFLTWKGIKSLVSLVFRR